MRLSDLSEVSVTALRQESQDWPQDHLPEPMVSQVPAMLAKASCF